LNESLSRAIPIPYGCHTKLKIHEDEDVEWLYRKPVHKTDLPGVKHLLYGLDVEEKAQRRHLAEKVAH
jgi:hypothetical protein